MKTTLRRSGVAAIARGAHPALSTLVAAVKKAGLVDTLNSQKAITVFAPTNDAFGKIAPDQLDGTHKTLEGDTVSISGSGDRYTVGAKQASIVCGNVPTAKATAYLISPVLMPTM